LPFDDQARWTIAGRDEKASTDGKLVRPSEHLVRHRASVEPVRRLSIHPDEFRAPDWLWCHDRYWESLYANPEEEIFIDLYVDPASGTSLPHDGRWVSVTGHLDDPAATRCDASVASDGQSVEMRQTSSAARTLW